jgi:hypothetical protein
MDIGWIASVSKRYSSFGYHAGYQNNPDNLQKLDMFWIRNTSNIYPKAIKLLDINPFT